MSRLLIFGDSIMKGVLYSEERGRHTMLSKDCRLLNSLLEERGVSVENRARFGATSQTVLHDARKILSAPQEDTTVLFGFGGNDSDYNWHAISEDPEGEHSPARSLNQLAETCLDCLQLAKDAGCRVMAANLVPIDAEKYFRWISRENDQENILHWLGDVSMLYRWHEEYSQRITNICRRENVPIADLREPFLLSHRFKTLLCADGIHPTTAGYALVDRAIAEALPA